MKAGGGRFLPSCLLKSRNRAGNARSFEARPMLSTPESTDFDVNGKIVCEIDSCSLDVVYHSICRSYVYHTRRSEFKMKIELSRRRLSNVVINRISFESVSLTRQIRGATPLESFIRVRKFCIDIRLNFILEPKSRSEFRITSRDGIFDIVNNVALYSMFDYIITTIIRIRLS